MEQIAVSFTDWGEPKTWLTPTVNIIDLAGNTLVSNWVCQELGNGWYIYNFDRYSPEKVYLYQFDWWAALSSDYDRYKFWGNELDAYSNKYSWGRTAAPYFTSVNSRFDKVDKSFKDIKKLKYDDKEVVKSLNEIKDVVKWQWWDSLKSKLDSLLRNLRAVQDAVVDTSATNEWNSSKNFSGINGKLDLMAEYIVKMKEDVDNWLWTLDDNVAQRIMESNANLNEWMANRVTIKQLLQQVERLENKMNTVLDAFVKTQMEWMLPKNITDRYDVNLSQKQMSDEDIMSALWINEWLNQWMNEWIEMWMEESIWEPRPEQVNAPVDMQGIAEPVMPNNI